MAAQWLEKQAIQQVKIQTGGVYNAFDDFLSKK